VFLIKEGLDKWLRMSAAESHQHFDVWSFRGAAVTNACARRLASITTTGAANG
jgi:hypothetical protein